MTQACPPLQLKPQQLKTLVQLGEDDPDVTYEDLMEIVEIARAALDNQTKVCSETLNGTERNGTERNG